MPMLDWPRLSIVNVITRGAKAVEKVLRTLLNPFWLCRGIRNFFEGHVDSKVPLLNSLRDRAAVACFGLTSTCLKSLPRQGSLRSFSIPASVPQAGDNRALG